jgi:hypothetical protein
VLWLLALCAGCGGGSSSVTTYTGSGTGTTTVTLDTPTGSNTTAVTVDSGPAGGFSLGTSNVPFVTVTICPPNFGVASSSGCVSIDHVFLDTGSYGLRLLKSKLAGLSLPPLTLAANTSFNTPAGTAVECYPFVLGGVWGPLAQADVHIAGETAAAIPIQVIDDSVNPALTAPADCVSAAGGTLFSNAASLQANGILGIGMIPYDCGLTCTSPLNYAGFHIQYYVCPDSVAANCQAAAVTIDQQAQNPVAHFVPDDGNAPPDNNGTLISLPALSAIGAGVATGRLVFGIGTRSNNQIAPGAQIIMADASPYVSTSTSTGVSVNTSTCTASATTTCANNPSYLYFTTTLGATSYPDSYIDSGSNAYFFNDASISQKCASSPGSASTGGWYCPPGSTPVALSAGFSDYLGHTATANFSIANADALFSTSSTAFSNLGGSITQAPQTFVWGLSFFFGRTVYTSILGQALSINGPWNAF